MKNLLLAFVLMLLSTNVSSQSVDMSYYFPNVNFDRQIPTPESVLRFVPGNWHASHDKLVEYMYALAEASPRITIQEIGATYENRPLLNLIVTTAANHANLDALQKSHLDNARGNSNQLDNVPTVLYQGYSIHGNESSGANAAILYAYYLAAAQEATQYLTDQIIIIDPCFNPDGFQRFSTWANTHRPAVPSSDPSDREFNEAWPGGRTNHYWFDLNRDWLLLQHPESRGRIKVFHEWMPNILTDHHEMGSNSTFFFQPGIPSRTNPITPQRNQDLTAAVGKYHAKELDKIGSQYYSEESFDDFYYGKGSTYPDANGCIGILFEQASSRGHVRMTDNGLLTFPFTVRNQLSTSISTLKAGHGLREDLLNFQRSFFADAKKEGNAANIGGYIIHDNNDPARTAAFLEVLAQHQIDCYSVKGSLSKNGVNYSSTNSYFVPTKQPQYRLIRGIFETQVTFRDSLFYDVSAWTLPMAYGLPYEAVSGVANLGEKIAADKINQGAINGKSEYGYLISWQDYFAPTAAHALMNADLRLKVCNQPFTADCNRAKKEFPRGTIFLPIQNQKMDASAIHKMLENLTAEYGLHVDAVDSGLTSEGIDLGSPNVEALEQPKVALLIGDGIRSYDAGEIWHLLDTRYEIPCTKITVDDFSRLRLSDYNVLIIPDGNPSGLSNTSIDKIKRWCRSGGVIIGLQGAASWLRGQELASLEKVSKGDDKKENAKRPYDKARSDNGAGYIGGAIFKNDLDLTHPICYGYSNSELPVFHQGTSFYKSPKNAYAAPLRYASDPLLGGYISKDNLDLIKESAGIVISGQGRGRVITFSFNPTFRAYWWGTQKLLANAIFFGSTIDGSTTE